MIKFTSLVIQIHIHSLLFTTIKYLVHIIKQPNFRNPNPQYLQRNFCFDFFNDSENTF